MASAGKSILQAYFGAFDDKLQDLAVREILKRGFSYEDLSKAQKSDPGLLGFASNFILRKYKDITMWHAKNIMVRSKYAYDYYPLLFVKIVVDMIHDRDNNAVIYDNNILRDIDNLLYKLVPEGDDFGTYANFFGRFTDTFSFDNQYSRSDVAKTMFLLLGNPVPEQREKLDGTLLVECFMNIRTEDSQEYLTDDYKESISEDLALLGELFKPDRESVFYGIHDILLARGGSDIAWTLYTDNEPLFKDHFIQLFETKILLNKLTPYTFNRYNIIFSYLINKVNPELLWPSQIESYNPVPPIVIDEITQRFRDENLVESARPVMQWARHIMNNLSDFTIFKELVNALKMTTQKI